MVYVDVGNHDAWAAKRAASLTLEDEMVQVDLNTLVSLLDEQMRRTGEASLDCYWRQTGRWKKTTEWRYRTLFDGRVYVCATRVCIPRIPQGCKVVRALSFWLPTDYV